MKSVLVIALVLSFNVLITNIYSQGNVSVHFGLSNPVLDLGSTDEQDGQGVGLGLNVGLQYVYPISESGLGIFAGIDINYNALKQEVQDDIEDEYKANYVDQMDIKYPKYINVPVTAGLNYTYQADEKIGVFVNGGTGIEFPKNNRNGN